MKTSTKIIPCKEWINKESNRNMISVLEQCSRVMSDPTKIKIILLLDQYNKHDDGTSKLLYGRDLSEHIGVSVSAISHSLRNLESQGLVTKQRHGQSSLYFLTPAGETLLECFSEIGKINL